MQALAESANPGPARPRASWGRHGRGRRSWHPRRHERLYSRRIGVRCRQASSTHRWRRACKACPSVDRGSYGSDLKRYDPATELSDMWKANVMADGSTRPEHWVSVLGLLVISPLSRHSRRLTTLVSRQRGRAVHVRCVVWRARAIWNQEATSTLG